MKHDFQTSRKPHAIVLGLDTMAGLQAARILAGHQIPVIAIANNPAHYNCRTKVCERIVYADTSGEELLQTLEVIGNQLEQKAVLVPCEDWNVLNVSRHRDQLKKWYHFILPDPSVVELIFDKVSFYSYAQKMDIPIPHTRFLKSRSDAEKASEEMTFPCVLKPPGRTLEWENNSPEKGFKVSNPKDLLVLYDLYHKWAKMLIVQEWVEGPDSNLCSCYCYFDSKSQPIVTFVARKLRQWPPENGMACLGEECRNDFVLEETVRLFKGLGLHGLGHLETKRDQRSGKTFIMEAHVVRPTGFSPIGEAGGVDRLYTMYCDALGWPFPENLTQKYEGVKWIHVRRDIQAAIHYWRKEELTIRDWFRSLRGIRAHAVFSWSDPGPFIADILRIFEKIPKRQKRFEK